MLFELDTGTEIPSPMSSAFMDGQDIIHTYSDVGNGSKTVIQYDSKKRKTSSEVFDDDGNTVKEETVYNEGGASKSAVTTYTYDYLCNVKTVREPRAAAENWASGEYTAQYEYDAAGNVTKETDVNGSSIME